MKKIKLFLITLLCMVGVMNVCAQEEFDVPVNSANGNILRRGNTWESKAVYGAGGGHLTIDDNAVFDGSLVNLIKAMEFSDGRDGNPAGCLKLNLIRENTITITAPEGYGISRYTMNVACNRASVNCGSGPVTSGLVGASGGGMESVQFTVNVDGDWEWGENVYGTVTCTDFVVYLTEKTTSPSGFLDADFGAVISGAMYLISTEPAKDDNRYFVAKDNGNLDAVGWSNVLSISNGVLVEPNSVYELTILNESTKQMTLKSMSADKYLGKAQGMQAIVAPDSKAEAMQFVYDGPYQNGGWGNRGIIPWHTEETDNFYTLKYNNKYLNYNSSGSNKLSMVDNVSVNIDYNTRSNQRFRFHRIDYVRIGVFKEQDGVLTPMDYSVNVIYDQGLVTTTNGRAWTELRRNGQSEVCCEHHQGKTGLTESIENRILSIVPDVDDEISAIQPKYIVNGSVVESINYSAIKTGYNISIIYELPTAPDPDDPTLPSAAGFYKLQTKVNGKYLNAVKNTAGTVDLTIDDNSDEDAIFYYDGSSLLSYTNGVFVKDNVMGDIEETGSKIQLVTNASSDNEKWDIRLGAQYLTCDNGGNSTTPIFAPKPSQEYTLNKVYDLPVKLNEVGGHYYGTFYAPVGVKVPEDSNLEAYVGTVTPAAPGEEYDVLKLKRVTEIPANTGVLLYVENDFAGGYTLTIDKKAAGNKGNLSGTCERYYVKSKGDNIYGLNKKDGVAGFFKMSPTSKLSAFRAFLQYEKSESAKGFVFSFSETDVIEALEMSHAEPIIYDLQGRRVQNPGTGIYIVNGKKIMITK